MGFCREKVSVIVPFFSNIDWLCDAIDSVLNQSYSNYEIVVVNDGSSECDVEFLARYGKFVRYFVTENRGPGAARNFGIEEASGEYIAFLDSDDLWLPEKLEKQIEFMKSNNFVWCHCSYSLFSATQEVIKIVNVVNLQGDLFLKRHISFPIATPCVMIKRRVFLDNSYIRFGEHLRYGEDSYLWGLINDIYPLGALDEVLVRVRIRGSNASRRARVQLQSKADTYCFIKDKRKGGDIRYIHFPALLFFLFFLANLFSNILRFIESAFKVSSNFSEFLSRLFYAPIYLGLKAYNVYLEWK